MRDFTYGEEACPNTCPVCGVPFRDSKRGQAGIDEMIYHALEHVAEATKGEK